MYLFGQVVRRVASKDRGDGNQRLEDIVPIDSSRRGRHKFKEGMKPLLWGCNLVWEQPHRQATQGKGQQLQGTTKGATNHVLN